MSKQVEVAYLYRDAGNYKLYGRAVLHCEGQRPIGELRQLLEGVLIDGAYFLPGALGISKPIFGETIAELDHDWLEFEDIRYTEEPATVSLDFPTFLSRLRQEQAAQQRLFNQNRP